mmetsp:Transcript_19551/g.21743  ORF Transcript_19551/g.21743 Transcript_19551/m.21743 type:complete len:100 (+) Transcript_19551:775-1074(+)
MRRLAGRPHRCFLVRASTTKGSSPFTLSVVVSRALNSSTAKTQTKHYRINVFESKYSLKADNQHYSASGLIDLINKCKEPFNLGIPCPNEQPEEPDYEK